MDIRDEQEIIFADDKGGIYRAIKLKKCVPSQFKIVSRTGVAGGYQVIEMRDVPNLIKALTHAQRIWSSTQ